MHEQPALILCRAAIITGHVLQLVKLDYGLSD